MLTHLSVHDVVAIDNVDVEFGVGLCVLTGETGAGKSILLDALGLALGRRADASLVREGADTATVAATFDVEQENPVLSMLESKGIGIDGDLVIRRTLTFEGRSRAFVNDQAVTIGFLSELGAQLIEIHGQNDRLGLLDPLTHRNVLDVAGNLDANLERVSTTYTEWSEARIALEVAQKNNNQAHELELELRHNVTELEGLGPKIGEESVLTNERKVLRHASSIADAVINSENILFPEAEKAVDQRIRSVRRLISDLSEKAAGKLDAVLEALDRASIELEEVRVGFDKIRSELNADPQALSIIEDRLFALRELARKNMVEIDELPQFLESEKKKLLDLEVAEEGIEEKRRTLVSLDQILSRQVEELREARVSAAKKLDLIVSRELKSLRMGNTIFATHVKSMPRESWGVSGGDQVAFTVATIPGSSLAPMHKIASGGELSRITLALRVATASNSEAITLIFDEIDTGTGGAVADSIGSRLARLSSKMQVIVVTHQPQIAVRADYHFHVRRQKIQGKETTSVAELILEERVEEIARMLAGAKITDEARAAAKRLMDEASK